MNTEIVWCPHCAKHGHLEFDGGTRIHRSFEFASQEVGQYFIQFWRRELRSISPDELRRLRSRVERSPLPVCEREVALYLRTALRNWCVAWERARAEGESSEIIFLQQSALMPHPVLM